jgi:hypothetical protein
VLTSILHARLRVHWAPGIPHALFWANDPANLGRIAPRECEVVSCRHCEAPTGRANARPMTGSATKQSIVTVAAAVDCFAPLAMTLNCLWLFEN